ncbi:MAG: ribosome maturation factor RimP [Alphaproteobacteria bacterium]|nr:ribosome maturation factor RimP [Alphaproteobacteria bacterium]
MAEAALADRVADLIAPSLTALGYAIVRVQLTGTKRRTLQIMAERSDARQMTVDDCAEISRNVSAILDVDDLIHGSYTLEVSSPGIDRPLVKPQDYETFAGHQARIELVDQIAGRRRFQGRLMGLDAGNVRVELADGTVDLPIDRIARAKLILTDELLAESQQQQKD